MLTVCSELDHVVLAFAKRGQTLAISPDVARRVAEEVRKAVRDCETWVKAGGSHKLVRGEPRGASVISYDGKVNVTFASVTDRESIPFKWALRLADLLEAKAVEARGSMTIIWTPQEPIS